LILPIEELKDLHHLFPVVVSDEKVFRVLDLESNQEWIIRNELVKLTPTRMDLERRIVHTVCNHSFANKPLVTTDYCGDWRHCSSEKKSIATVLSEKFIDVHIKIARKVMSAIGVSKVYVMLTDSSMVPNMVEQTINHNGVTYRYLEVENDDEGTFEYFFTSMTIQSLLDRLDDLITALPPDVMYDEIGAYIVEPPIAFAS
jgi:hypothetical protein